MLPDDRDVREAMLDWEGGIAASLPSGAVVLDMSSSNPDGTRALGERLAALGIRMVDAPVSGGVTRAEAGTLSLMIGGDDDAVADVQPVLDVLGERLFRTGALGTGHAMKALNNFVGGSTYAVVVEALAVGQRFGLSPQTMIDVMNASSGRSFNTEHVVKDHVLTGAYATGFAVGLLAKDVGIAAALAESAGVEAPLCRLVSRRFAEAAAALGPAADHSEAHRQWWPAVLAETAAER
jgi:3-hydroxyisobutyrate dehydrogenase